MQAIKFHLISFMIFLPDLQEHKDCLLKRIQDERLQRQVTFFSFCIDQNFTLLNFHCALKFCI